MDTLKRLWADEAGLILSAETVMIGTVAVLALTAGVSTMATAVNSELNEMGMAFRSFNQSFSVPGYQAYYISGVDAGESVLSNGSSSQANAAEARFIAGTVGSSYVQPPVAESQQQLQLLRQLFLLLL